MKSTHSGHCQACGRLQKLPSGLLSLHGYTVDHGYFSGTCSGAKHLPFEVSCDMLPGFVASAQAALAGVEREQAHLREMPTEPRAWVRNYEGSAYGRNAYVWRQVHVDGELKTYDTSSWIEYFYRAPSTNGALDVRHKIETYRVPGTEHCTAPNVPTDARLAVAHKLNSERADAMEKEVRNLRRYIAWQQERIATWKPAPLLAHDAKDKLGFVVNV